MVGNGAGRKVKNMSRHRKKKHRFKGASMGGKLSALARGDSSLRHEQKRVGVSEMYDADKFAAVKTCSICEKNFTGWDNNARPINDGRCCNECNEKHVIPARIEQRYYAKDPIAMAKAQAVARGLGDGDVRVIANAVQEPFKTVANTVLDDIHRKNDKLEQALRQAGIITDDHFDGVHTVEGKWVKRKAGFGSVASDVPFSGTRREEMFNFRAGFSDGRPANEQEQAAAESDLALVREWLTGGHFKLKAPQHPLMHKALKALDLRRVYDEDGKLVEIENADTADLQSLLVHHDWAAVLGDAPDTQGEWIPPYTHQCFEFLVSASPHGEEKLLPVLAFVNEESNRSTMLICMRTFTKGWIYDCALLSLMADNFRVDARASQGRLRRGLDLSALRPLIFKQVRACCILLEAEVAETTPIRDMTYRRNEPPKDNSEPLPKLGYNVVSLADRHHTERLPPGEIHQSTRRRPRLHFRRRHWRHYPTHRTQIPWTLAGNPELGFVEKEYRL